MRETRTICIVVALACEAKPLIQHFKLKRDHDCKAFALYRGKGVRLIISGIGRVRAAAACSHLLAQAEDAVAVNLGVAGSCSGHAKGKLLIVNKITDTATNRDFYLDMLARTRTEMATLSTCERVHSDRDSIASDLVDMEASGFVDTASLYLPWHRIACLKIVSDHLGDERVEAQIVSQMIGAVIRQIEAIVEAYHELASLESRDVIGRAEDKWLDEVRARLRLTATQTEQLRDVVRHFKVRGNDELPNVMLPSKSIGKAEVKRYLGRLINELG